MERMDNVPITDQRFKAVYGVLRPAVSPNSDALVDYAAAELTQDVLAALGLDDLDAFVVRVADDLYGVHSDAYRRGLVARALEAALTATGEGEAS